MTEKPEVKIRVSPEGIPPELKNLPRWVLWKHTWSNRTKRWGKVPYQPSGRMAASDNPDTWCGFEQAFAAVGAYDGLGFVFNGDGITGIDLDKVIGEDGQWSDKAAQILHDVPGYAELSPSGRGLHIITRTEHIGEGKNKGGIEAYSTGRYFTFTGHQLNGHTSVPADLQDIKPFLAQHFGDAAAKYSVPTEDLDEAIAKLPKGRSIEEMRAALVHVPTPPDEPACTPYIWAIHHETSGSNEGLQLAHDWCSGEVHGKEYPEYEFDYVEDRWPRSKDDKGNAKTWRSVETEARKNGWSGINTTPVATSDFVQAAAFSSAQKIEWHIKHVIPKRGLIVVYGAPGSSKSFFVLDLVAHIARGLEWRGHRTKQSRVAYVAAEGVAGFGNRLAAYAKHHDVELADVPVFVRGGSLMLNTSAIEITQSVKDLGNVGIVVIDTLAAVTPGANENTSEDMGEAIKSANLIVEGTGASVILIHHSNKGGELRGWSGLLAAADNTIRVEHEESTGLRAAHVEKQKEGRSDGKYGYHLRVVELGQDEDGDTITSCAIEPCAETAPNTRTEKKERKSRSGSFESSRNYEKARAYLATVLELIEASPNKEISLKDAVQGIQSSVTHNPEGFENHPDRSNVRKSLGALTDKGLISIELGVVRLPDEQGDLSDAR